MDEEVWQIDEQFYHQSESENDQSNRNLDEDSEIYGVDSSSNAEVSQQQRAPKDGQFYQLLYEIEYLVKLVEQNQQKFVIVKWRNFSTKECTKEPYEYIQKLQLLKDQVQKLQEQYEQKKYSPEQVVNLKAKTRQFIENYRASIFPQSILRKKKLNKQKREPSIEEIMRCKSAAYQSTKKKLQLQLNDLTPQDYFYFKNLYHDCQNQVRQEVRAKRFKQTDLIPEEVVALSRNGDSFKYCVQLPDQKMYSYTQQQMREHFPRSFTKFLKDLLDIMEQYMALEIDYEEKMINHRMYRLKEVHRARQMIANKENMEATKQPVFFGLDIQDALRNRRAWIEKTRGFEVQDDIKEQGSFDSKSNKSEKGVLYDFCEEMQQAMRELGIRTPHHKKKKKKNEEGVLDLNQLDIQYHKYNSDIQFEPQQDSENSFDYDLSDNQSHKPPSKKDQKQLKIKKKGSGSSNKSVTSKSKDSMDEEVSTPIPSRSSSRIKHKKTKSHFIAEDDAYSQSSSSSRKRQKRE